MTENAIADHAIIGDLSTAAAGTTDGRSCRPRFAALGVRAASPGAVPDRLAAGAGREVRRG